MAVISKIRNQSALLIGVIGLAMVLFLLGDLLGSGSGLFNQVETDVAEIGGKKISLQEFEARVQKEIGDQNFDEQARESVRQRVWNMLIQERVMYVQYDELGLSVSPEELYYQVKNTGPNSIMNQYFTNPQTGQIFEQFQDPYTGGLSPEKVLTYIRQVLESDQAASWVPVEKAIKIDRLSAKYFNLLSKGLNITNADLEAEIKNRAVKANFSYVGKNYTAIDDAQITFTDADLNKYYNKHKNEPQFEQKETTRGIEYIAFRVSPSDKDVNVLLEEMIQIKNEFAQAKNDTTFVNSNADTPFNIRYFKKGQLNQQIDSIAFAANIDTVFGPYQEDEFYLLSKVIGSKTSSDSVNARHILLPIENNDTVKAISLADSLKNVAKKEKNFASLAMQFSQDQGSAQNGGDLNWFTEGMMVKPFNDACFNGNVGDMVVVTSQFGVHLIEILDKTKEVKKVLVATVNREIRPSKATFDKVFNEASAFSINNNTLETFRSQGAQYGIQQAPSFKENDKVLGAFDSPRELIRWAYAADKGAVSEPFEMGDQFVVACLTNIKPAGILPLDEVKDQIQAEVIKEKKAEMLISQIDGKTQLPDVATTWGEQVKKVNELTFGSFSIPGIGPEGDVTGVAFSLNQGEVSKPIIGKRGVYVIQLESLTEAQQIDKNQIITDLQRGYTSRVDFEVFNALKELANITDNRAKFY